MLNLLVLAKYQMKRKNKNNISGRAEHIKNWNKMLYGRGCRE